MELRPRSSRQAFGRSIVTPADYIVQAQLAPLPQATITRPSLVPSSSAAPIRGLEFPNIFVEGGERAQYLGFAFENVQYMSSTHFVQDTLALQNSNKIIDRIIRAVDEITAFGEGLDDFVTRMVAQFMLDEGFKQLLVDSSLLQQSLAKIRDIATRGVANSNRLASNRKYLRQVLGKDYYNAFFQCLESAYFTGILVQGVLHCIKNEIPFLAYHRAACCSQWNRYSGRNVPKGRKKDAQGRSTVPHLSGSDLLQATRGKYAGEKLNQDRSCEVPQKIDHMGIIHTNAERIPERFLSEQEYPKNPQWPATVPGRRNGRGGQETAKGARQTSSVKPTKLKRTHEEIQRQDEAKKARKNEKESKSTSKPCEGDEIREDISSSTDIDDSPLMLPPQSSLSTRPIGVLNTELKRFQALIIKYVNTLMSSFLGVDTGIPDIKDFNISPQLLTDTNINHALDDLWEKKDYVDSTGKRVRTRYQDSLALHTFIQAIHFNSTSKVGQWYHVVEGTIQAVHDHFGIHHKNIVLGTDNADCPTIAMRPSSLQFDQFLLGGPQNYEGWLSDGIIDNAIGLLIRDLPNTVLINIDQTQASIIPSTNTTNFLASPSPNMRIVFPINHTQQHWTLAALDLKTRQFYHFDSLPRQNTADPRPMLLKILRNQGRKNKDSASLFQNVAVPSTTGPRQQNGSDCGFFAVANAFAFAIHGRAAGNHTTSSIRIWLATVFAGAFMQTPFQTPGSGITGDISMQAKRFLALQMQQFQEIQESEDVEILSSDFPPSSNELKFRVEEEGGRKPPKIQLQTPRTDQNADNALSSFPVPTPSHAVSPVSASEKSGRLYSRSARQPSQQEAPAKLEPPDTVNQQAIFEALRELNASPRKRPWSTK